MPTPEDDPLGPARGIIVALIIEAIIVCIGLAIAVSVQLF
tara:strand:- start:1002 stop:1121 length:120 start_codon:yes stop_codon:yes gene_type:complete